MLSRRLFLGSLSAGTLAAGAVSADSTLAAPAAEPAPPAPPPPAGPRKKLAVVTTLWNYHSHAWHMAERFLAGRPHEGSWHMPPLDVVSAYVDQRPEGDLSQGRADEFGFEIYSTVAQALCCGGKELAVDAVLLIGEHGKYPVNAIGQTQYPRYELFQQIVAEFRKSGRAVPVFNDKHLSWNFAWAKEMVATARELKFPFLAGSSLPVTWRMPAVDLPWEAQVEEALVVAIGSPDSYDFHALEALQCLVERRRGGETGVVRMHALKGDAVWQALAAGSWAAGGWSPRLWEACLARSHTLAQPESCSHRYPTFDQVRQFVTDPVAYRFEYADGLKATMLLMNGLVQDFTVAVQIRGAAEPLSTLFHLPPNPNVVYSAALMAQAEQMFLTGLAPYPVERTLLTSGLVAAGLQSLADGKEVPTPHLAIRYTALKESTFWQR